MQVLLAHKKKLTYSMVPRKEAVIGTMIEKKTEFWNWKREFWEIIEVNKK